MSIMVLYVASCIIFPIIFKEGPRAVFMPILVRKPKVKDCLTHFPALAPAVTDLCNAQRLHGLRNKATPTTCHFRKVLHRVHMQCTQVWQAMQTPASSREYRTLCDANLTEHACGCTQ